MISTILALALQAAAASPSPAPDYTQDSAWLCRPGRADACAVDLDVTVIQASGKRKIERFKRAAAPAFDCFYVYPTMSMDPTPNSDMVPGQEEKDIVAAQAARFTAACRVFAPVYRQVTQTALQSMLSGGTPMQADREMPLADVTAAWNDYLARDNHGRGVVLIGHSQGAMVLKTLLAQTIEGSAIRRNIISAMLIGMPIAVPPGQAVGGDFKRFPLCRADTQYGCVIAYSSFRADSPPPADSLFGKVATPGMVAACTNPAALAGGKATSDAVLGTAGAGVLTAPMGPWTSDALPVTTPFVRVPGLISTECVSQGGYDYLAVTVNADPADARTDTIVGDVVFKGAIVKSMGLHAIDVPLEMGNLVALADRQAMLWRGVTPKK